jgi:hypothetical protein
MEVTEHELRVMCIVIRMSISIRVMLFPDLMSIKHPFCTCILLSLISSIIGVWIHSLSEMTVRYVMIVDVLWRYGMFIISWLYCKTTGAFTGQVQNSNMERVEMVRRRLVIARARALPAFIQRAYVDMGNEKLTQVLTAVSA